NRGLPVGYAVPRCRERQRPPRFQDQHRGVKRGWPRVGLPNLLAILGHIEPIIAGAGVDSDRLLSRIGLGEGHTDELASLIYRLVRRETVRATREPISSLEPFDGQTGLVCHGCHFWGEVPELVSDTALRNL